MFSDPDHYSRQRGGEENVGGGRRDLGSRKLEKSSSFCARFFIYLLSLHEAEIT